MSAQNQFAGGYNIPEKEPGALNKFGDAPEENLKPFTNLNNDPLERGGGVFKPFDETDNIKVFAEVEEEGNPDDILTQLDSDELESGTEEDVPTKDAELLSEKTSKQNEHPLSPVINSFIPRGLSGEQASIIKSGLIDGGEIKDILSNMDINANNAKSLIEALDYLQKPEVKEGNKENFNKDFKDYLEVFKVDGEDGKKQFSGITSDMVEMLGSNYFVNLDQRDNGNEGSQKKSALNIAFETSANEIIDGISIKRDETFDEMMKIIKNPELDFSERFEELIKLNKEVSTGEGVKGIKDKKDGKTIKSKLVANNNANDAFQEGQRNRAQAETELQANNTALEASEILNTPEEIGGDIFTAGDLDTATASV